MKFGECSDDLLRRPFSRRMGRDIEMNEVPSVVTQHDKCEKYAERGRRNDEEIDRNDVAQMIVQEGPQILRWRIAMPNPIPTHRCFDDSVT